MQAAEDTAEQAIEASKKTAPHTHSTIENRLASLEPAVDSHEDKITSISELSTSLDERTVVLEDRAKIVKAQLFDLVSRAGDTADLNDRLREVAEVAPSIETHHRKIEALNDWVTIVDGRIIDIQTQGNTTQDHIEAINDWIASIDSRMLSVEEHSDDASDERLTDLDERTIKLENQAQTTLEQFAAADEQAITNQQRFDAANEQFTAIDEQLIAIDERITTLDSETRGSETLEDSGRGDLSDQITSLDERATELEALTESAQGDIESTTQLLAELDEKITDLAEQEPQSVAVAGAVVDRAPHQDAFDAAEERLDFFQRQINFNQEQIDEADERIKGLDIRTTALINESIKGLDDRTQALETLSGGTDEVGAGERLATHDQHIEAVNDWMTTLDGRVLDLKIQAESTHEYIESANLQHRILDERVLEVQKHGYYTQEQIEAVHEAAANIEVRTSVIEARFAESQTAAAEAESVTQRTLEETQTAVAETKASLEALSMRVDESSSTETDELRDFMVYRLDSAEDRIDRRLAEIESSGADTDRLEQLERSVAEAEQRATDAYAFSENLRLLQTDLVQALQSEIETCARDLKDARMRLEDLELRFS